MRFMGGIPVFVPNSVYDGDGFHVSHNSRDIAAYGSVTTALVKDGSRFYILRGDHREAYLALIAQGFEACLAYYTAHPEQQHPYSDALPA